MWLLNSTTLRLKSFAPDKVSEIKYAILSHRWIEMDGEELLFADIANETLRTEGNETAKTKLGYQKLQYSCKEAADNHISYVWIDTCCINKSSSAELSEAINSMYPWYTNAQVCYAYMSDVPEKDFSRSEWFERGWTLQELIAPKDLIFFSSDWSRIGTKETLRDRVSTITGVDVEILAGAVDLETQSVAKRMSWAADRKTSRPEDKAYCLMGIFSVNMPMLYGEGEKAFIRLQEEIMRHTDDHSIFAWFDPEAEPDSHYGLLAKQPKLFKHSGNIVPNRGDEVAHEPFSLTNRGIRIDLHLSPTAEKDLYVAALDCPPLNHKGHLGIYLRCLSAKERQYARIWPQDSYSLTEQGSIQRLYVRQDISISGPQEIYPQHSFQLRRGPEPQHGYRLINVEVPPGSKPPARLQVRGTHDWILPGLPITFEISKGTKQVAAALALERWDRESRRMLLISLASTSKFGVAFDAVEVADVPAVIDVEETFIPHEPGSLINLVNHQVRVKAEAQPYAGVKYYLVDLFVEPVERPPNPFEMVVEMGRDFIQTNLPVQLDARKSRWKILTLKKTAGPR